LIVQTEPDELVDGMIGCFEVLAVKTVGGIAKTELDCGCVASTEGDAFSPRARDCVSAHQAKHPGLDARCLSRAVGPRCAAKHGCDDLVGVRKRVDEMNVTVDLIEPFLDKLPEVASSRSSVHATSTSQPR
jgi:hypothetical protein